MGFGLTLALMISVTLVGLTRMDSINNNMRAIVTRHTVKTGLAVTMRKTARERALLIHMMLLDKDPIKSDERYQRYLEYSEEFTLARKTLERTRLDKQERFLLETAIRHANKTHATQQKILDQIRKDPVSTANGHLALEALPGQYMVLNSLNKLVEYQKISTRTAVNQANEEYALTFRQMVWLGALTVLIGLGIALYVVRKTQILQERMNRSRLAAEQAARAKSDFLANMSHEIRTPLNAIIGMSGLLKNSELSEQQKDYINTIENSGDALLSVINDILDYSKIEAGKFELEQRSFELRQCVEDTLDLLAPKAAEKQLELAAQIDPAIHGACLGDENRLRQVLINLANNAIKFTHVGEVVLGVKLEENLADNNCLLHFSVRDTGIGIDKDKVGKLFKSFTQADSSMTRRYGGTGLGLTISKQLVELMGGQIWVESEPGVGSTFHFTISLKQAHEQAIEGSVEAGMPTSMAGRRILIVDDNLTNRLILLEYLRAWGVEPHSAASGMEALGLLNIDHNFDAAILDMQMPGMDGLELARRIHHLPEARRLPLILLTSVGYDSQQLADQFAAYASKPVKASHLHKVLSEVLMMPGSHAEKTTSPSKIDEHLAKRHPLTILLAEDNAVNQKVAVLILKRMGYQTDLANNGWEAITALENKHYDLVLMDVQMPIMDGLEATHEICKRWPRPERPCIVAMTANALPHHRQECIDAGMDYYISKPIILDDLASVLATCHLKYVHNPGNKMTDTPDEIPSAAPSSTALEENKTDTIDHKVLDELVTMMGGDASILDDLIGAYLDETPVLVERLAQAASTGNWTDINSAAHAIKSSSASLGAMALSETAKLLEHDAANGEVKDAVTRATDLKQQFSAASKALAKLRKL